ncbi:hypothetical protein [Azospirillum halopraeferens]|uniref:hypothetical protein n=1 Tax=Azospirillum halopraeferens TaxID=34010 RepID=UPI0003FBD397|nr:hypothetical protein [Azospirillum halopraeferens]
MSWSTEGASLADVLEPVLCVAEDDEGELVQAVNDVAEALAALGVLIVDRAGQPVHGVSDERAVIGALAAYAKGLAHGGRLDDAVSVGELIDRIDQLRYRPKRPGVH